MTKTITVETLPTNAVELFKLYVKDAGNWSGTPLVNGNVTLLGEKEDRGLLSYLKRAGVIATWNDEGCTWLRFTRTGFDFAKSLEMDVSEDVLSGYSGWRD